MVMRAGFFPKVLAIVWVHACYQGALRSTAVLLGGSPCGELDCSEHWGGSGRSTEGPHRLLRFSTLR